MLADIVVIQYLVIVGLIAYVLVLRKENGRK